jgi:glycosyltransferase involved in cell wall biosynthesis
MTSKIFILENSVEISGAFNSIIEYSYILKRNFDFAYGIQRTSKLKDKLLKNGFEVVCFSFIEIQKSPRLLAYLPMLVYNTFKALRYIRDNHIEIMHVNDMYNMIGVLAKIVKPDLYVVYHIRLLKNSYISRLYNCWSYLINRFADQIICVSKAVSNSYPFDQRKMSILYDAIDTTMIKSKKILPSVRGHVNLYYIGNYIMGKGQDLAIRAFSKALKVNPDLRLTFFGGTFNKKKNLKYKNELIKRVKELQLSDCITFKGLVNIKDVYPYADIILNFSENEAFSMVCLEALAYGKPLIASNSGGPSEIIDHNVNGILVMNRNIDQMADAIINLSRNMELRKKFLLNGPKKVEERFNVQRNAVALHKIYQQGISS